MSDLDDIAAALAHQIDSIEGISGVDAWPNQLNPPVAIVNGPTAGTYRYSFEGGEEYMFDIDVIVNIPAIEGFTQAQRDLRPFLSKKGPASIASALEAGKTFGGLIAALYVERFTVTGQVEIDDNPNRYAATVSVRVQTPC